MDQSKFADVEERIICPYDPIHEVSRLRMATHLQRCRKNFKELSEQLLTCSFNYAHKIPKPELEFHETHCPDREAYYAFEYSVGTKENASVQELLKNTTKEIDIPKSESWDSELDTPGGTNVLNAIERSAENRGVLICHQNMPPAERKMKREEDRQKMKTRLNAEEQAKQDHQISSVVSTSSAWPALNERASTSRAGLSSACSVMSDSSYTTALNTAAERMQEFQVVTKKKGRGRSGRVESTTSTSLAGVGRGRARPRKDED